MDGAITNSAPLPRAFYARDTIEVARALIGAVLIRATEEEVTAGVIVETEAYLAAGDSACHAARGKTRSNAAMFGPPGRAYVYPIHSRYCFNAVSGADEEGTAVLIRAVQPIAGEAAMRRRRRRQKPLELARGPARLCEAFAIDRELDHWDLTLGDSLWIAANPAIDEPPATIVSPRIGVTSASDLPLRFYRSGCRFVSGKRSRSPK